MHYPCWRIRLPGRSMCFFPGRNGDLPVARRPARPPERAARSPQKGVATLRLLVRSSAHVLLPRAGAAADAHPRRYYLATALAACSSVGPSTGAATAN